MTRSKLPEAPVPPAVPESAGQAEGVSRRTLLTRLAKLGIATTALTAGGLELVSYRDEARSATPAGKPSKPAHAWCMVIDLRYCDGCESCVLACQQRHELTKDQTWLKVYTMTDDAGGTFHMPRPCMMCEKPPCVNICPVGATYRTADGLVLVDQNVCIGCRACMAACPYDARYFNWTQPPAAKRLPTPPTPEFPVPQRKGTVGKCVFCADRLPNGELPACLTGCPMGVLYMGDLVTDVAVNGFGTTVKLSEFLEANDAVRFKEELGTNPRVYYILGHGQNLEA
jgi:Fe-S-cluster-containing dehydrogenase component